MLASLVIPYRGRLRQLEQCLAALRDATKSLPLETAIEVIVVEGDLAPSVRTVVENWGADRYHHVQQDGPFNKSQLLNYGLMHCRGEMLMPYDVDLRPFPDVLRKHLKAASEARRVGVVAGYRVMVPCEAVGSLGPGRSDAVFRQAPEDSQSALRKQLLCGERFGISPVFSVARLAVINGWDESFRGWGAEDQDVLERYLTDGLVLLRSPDLLYAHCDHGEEKGWRESSLVEENRRRYHEKRLSRRQHTE